MTDPYQITCPECGSTQTVSIEKISSEGAWGRCAVCRHRVFIDPPGTPPASDSPQPSGDSWTPGPPEPQPPYAPEPEVGVEASKATSLTVKTPDGRTERLTIKEVREQVRSQKLLPWDLVSEDGGRFAPIQNHPEFKDSFYDAASSGPLKTCWNHKDKVSEKLCARCQRCYCADCVPPPRSGTSTLSCLACGGVLQDTDPGWRLKPYWKRLKEVVTFPKGQYAMAATLGLAIVLWVTSLSLVLMPFGILALIFLVYVLAGSAKGQETLKATLQTKPTGDDIRLVVERSLVTLAVVFTIAVPFVVVNAYLPLSMASALTFVLSLAAFAYHPMAIAIAVLSEKPLFAFRPQVVMNQMQALGDDYPALLIGLLILYAAVFIVQIFSRFIPVLGGLIAAFAMAYGAILTAHVLGWTFYLNFGRLGWKRTSIT
jgi:hypothetical protein